MNKTSTIYPGVISKALDVDPVPGEATRPPCKTLILSITGGVGVGDGLGGPCGPPSASPGVRELRNSVVSIVRQISSWVSRAFFIFLPFSRVISRTAGAWCPTTTILKSHSERLRISASSRKHHRLPPNRNVLMKSILERKKYSKDLALPNPWDSLLASKYHPGIPRLLTFEIISSVSCCEHS